MPGCRYDLVVHKPVDLSRLPLRIREVISAALPAESGQAKAENSEHGYSLDIADEYVEVLVAELGVERARSCITAFLSETAIHIPTLCGQVQAEDWHAVANLAHNLAGAAGTLGAATLTDALLMMEQFAGLEDKTCLLAALGEVETVWDRTRTALRRRFDFVVARRSGAVSKAA